MLYSRCRTYYDKIPVVDFTQRTTAFLSDNYVRCEMGKFSQAIANRYSLQLDDGWIDWFDRAATLRLPGGFRIPVDSTTLCDPAPNVIWPGLMLPDTLPILSNGYGDWICVRVLPDNRLGELLHWYHGGGDWIPVGDHIAEAILHDAVDSIRPVRQQMLRGAVESSRITVRASTFTPQFIEWLVERLSAIRPGYQAAELQSTIESIEGAQYEKALQQLSQWQIANDVIACDRLEMILHQSLIGERVAYSTLPKEIWSDVNQVCQAVLQRRQDLGWSHAMLGLSQSFQGDSQAALDTFYAGRFASAFSDQSVRLRLHHFDHTACKFLIARLMEAHDELPARMLADPYLQLFLNESSNKTTQRVQDYWLTGARESFQRGDFVQAYTGAYSAGWDVGATSMSSYHRILDLLQQSARQAGWAARAAVAETHLARCQ